MAAKQNQNDDLIPLLVKTTRNKMESPYGCHDNDEGSDSSSSSSLRLPEPSIRRSRIRREYDKQAVRNANPSSASFFNPNEKGTKKQKRCDYDSDDRSYDGLGLEHKRRNLMTEIRKDSLLPSGSKMIDFDHHGSKTWGDRLLLERLKEPEIDFLLGLATSFDVVCGGNGGAKLVLEDSENTRKNADAPSQSFNSITTSSTDSFFHCPQRHNPLLSVTYDTPFPPSHVNYVNSRAMHHVQNVEGSNIQTQFEDSVAVAMSMYLEECITASFLPLAGLHVLRCRALEDIASAENDFCAMPMASFGDKNGDCDGNGKQQRQRKARSINNPITLRPISINPITGEEVKFDRDRQIRWKEENAFEEWTLPPEEAIIKLMEQGIFSNTFPYNFIPDASRYWTSTIQLKSSSRNVNENSAVVSNNTGIKHSSTLSKSHRIDPSIWSTNKEIFDIFQPQNTYKARI